MFTSSRAVLYSAEEEAGKFNKKSIKTGKRDFENNDCDTE